MRLLGEPGESKLKVAPVPKNTEHYSLKWLLIAPAREQIGKLETKLFQEHRNFRKR
jgi:hypothetical protein